MARTVVLEKGLEESRVEIIVAQTRVPGSPYAESGWRVVAVAYDEILSAFEFVSSAAPVERSAYISLDTGQVHWVSELCPVDEDIPDDLETSDRCVAVPHKNDLGLGKRLALRFAAEELPGFYEQAAAIFRRKGGYSRFKRLLETKGVLETWYEFEARATERALKEWCAQNDIPLAEQST